MNDKQKSLFIVWSSALNLVDFIRGDLASATTITADLRVTWSDSLLPQNLKRLYKELLIKGDCKEYQPEKIRGNSFHLFCVETDSNEKILHRSAAGEFEWSARQFVEKKKAYRQLCQDRNMSPYLIHSAFTQKELELQLGLIVGPRLAFDILANKVCEQETLKSDLMGANGWDDLRSAFNFLSFSCRWCVLRNFDSLPSSVVGDDIDILVEDRETAASLLGLVFDPDDKDRRAGKLMMKDGTHLKIDLHWLGDGYFDVVWQAEILDKRVLKNDIYRPDPEGYFFTYLYNELINRPTPRPEKMILLGEQELFIPNSGWLNTSLIASQKKLCRLLADYMCCRGYIRERPKIIRHDQNISNLKMLPKLRFSTQNSQKRMAQLWFVRKSQQLLSPNVYNLFRSIYRYLRS